jgi:GxxExxY protein
MSSLRHKKLTYELRGLIFEVRDTLKAGWSEEVYHQALLQLLEARQIPVQSKARRAIHHRGLQVHLFECDLLVWDLIILELKALSYAKLASVHQAQLFHYLKCWGKDLGLLVNFGGTRVEIERLIWDEPALEIEESYDLVKSYFTEKDRDCLRQVRTVILAIGRQYGLGYPETMYRRIVELELRHQGLACSEDVIVPVQWQGAILRGDKIDHLLVEGRYLVSIRALLEFPSRLEFAQTKNYLQHLGLQFGLVVNFGKRQLQIYGVKAG